MRPAGAGTNPWSVRSHHRCGGNMTTTARRLPATASVPAAVGLVAAPATFQDQHLLERTRVR